MLVEGVEDNFTGFLCEENSEACAEAIQRAIGDHAHLAQVGKNAADHIYLSWNDAVAKAYTRYEEIVTDWPSPLPYRKQHIITD